MLPFNSIVSKRCLLITDQRCISPYRRPTAPYACPVPRESLHQAPGSDPHCALCSAGERSRFVYRRSLRFLSTMLSIMASRSLVASSSNRRTGFWTSARATAGRWRCPPDRLARCARLAGSKPHLLPILFQGRFQYVADALQTTAVLILAVSE